MTRRRSRGRARERNPETDGEARDHRLFVQAPESPPPPAQKSETPAPAPKGTPQQAPLAIPSAPPAAQAAPLVPYRSARITGPLYRAGVTSHGGELSAWDLIYRGEKPMIIPGRLGPRGVTVERAGQPPRVVDFSLSPDSLELGRSATGEITLVGEDGFGLRITQTLRFRADGYDVDRVIRVENRNRAPQTAEIALGWSTPVTWAKDITEKFQGQHPTRVARSVNGNARREELAKVTDLVGEGRWIGLESEWYLSALVPRSAGFRLAETKANDVVQVALLVWFYVTPVIYPLRLAGGLRGWLAVNPLTGCVELMRAAVVGADPGWGSSLVWCAAWTVVFTLNGRSSGSYR